MRASSRWGHPRAALGKQWAKNRHSTSSSAKSSTRLSTPRRDFASDDCLGAGAVVTRRMTAAGSRVCPQARPKAAFFGSTPERDHHRRRSAHDLLGEPPSLNSRRKPLLLVSAAPWEAIGGHTGLEPRHGRRRTGNSLLGIGEWTALAGPRMILTEAAPVVPPMAWRARPHAMRLVLLEGGIKPVRSVSGRLPAFRRLGRCLSADGALDGRWRSDQVSLIHKGEVAVHLASNMLLFSVYSTSNTPLDSTQLQASPRRASSQLSNIINNRPRVRFTPDTF